MRSSCRRRCTRRVRACGAGLRALHDALPIDACPVSRSVTDRLLAAREAGLPPDLPEVPLVDRLTCPSLPCALFTEIQEFSLGVRDRACVSGAVHPDVVSFS